MGHIHELTALARLLDPDYATNRWVALLALGTGILGSLVALVGGSGLPTALWQGLLAAGAVFAAWALAREIDPDAEKAALVAGGLAIAWMGAVWLTGARPPSLALAFALLLLCRMVARTVGSPPRPLDGPVVLALAAWAGFGTGAWTVLAVAAAGFGADRALTPRGPAYEVVFGGLALAVAFAVAWRQGVGPAPVEADAAYAFAAATTALLVLRLFRPPTLRAKADATGQPLRPARVRAAMGLALALAAASLGFGRPHVLEAGVLWAALGGVGATHVGRSLGARLTG